MIFDLSSVFTNPLSRCASINIEPYHPSLEQVSRTSINSTYQIQYARIQTSESGDARH